MTMDPAGNITVVQPGSADDPFTANPGGVVAGAAGLDIGGAAPVSIPANTTKEAPPFIPNSTREAAAAAAAAAAATAASATAVADKPLTRAEVDAMMNTRIAGVQSAADKRFNVVQAELEKAQAQVEAAREDGIKREREALTERLTPEELVSQKVIWQGEDRLRALETREKAVFELYGATEGQRLLSAYGAHGITEDDILGYTGNPVGLEDFVKGLAFDRLTATGATAADAAGRLNGAAAAVAAGAPAGATGRQDIAGTPGALPGNVLDKGRGAGAMANNVRKLFSEGPDTAWG